MRIFENKLNVMALDEDEKPGKSTDPKIKYIRNISIIILKTITYSSFLVSDLFLILVKMAHRN